MANTKTTKKSVTPKAATKEVVEEKVNSTNLAEENAELKQQLAEMMANYKDMQLQMQTMLLAAQNANNKIDGSCIVGCRIFNGVTLTSQGGDISIPIKYKEEVEVSFSELREIFKNPFGYKNMFKKGILYFAEQEDYKRFSLNVDIDLSDDALIKMLSGTDANALVEEIKVITKDKKDLAEVFALIYQIADLIDNKKVDLEYNVRSVLERYFNVDFNTLINNLHDKTIS